MTKVSEEKKEFARVLYMSDEQQNIIAEKVGVSKNTVSRWVVSEGWDKKRAAQNISRPELVNKILLSIDKMIENSLNDPDKEINSDQLSKLAATIKSIDKKASVVDVMEVFINAGRFLQKQVGIDPKITPDALKLFTYCQDVYVNRLLSSDAE